MKLYFQFLTLDKSTEVTKLLDLMTMLVEGRALEGKLKLHAHGALTYSSFADLPRLVNRLAIKRFNELILTPEVSSISLRGSRFQIKSLECNLVVSPTCALWFPTCEWRNDGDRASDNRYRTAKSHETALRFYGVIEEPSFLGVLMDVKTRLKPDEILDDWANRLGNGVCLKSLMGWNYSVAATL